MMTKKKTKQDLHLEFHRETGNYIITDIRKKNAFDIGLYIEFLENRALDLINDFNAINELFEPEGCDNG